VDAFAVAGEGHIGSVSVLARVGERMDAVDRRPLTLVNGDGVAMRHRGEALGVADHPAAVVELDDEAAGLGGPQGEG